MKIPLQTYSISGWPRSYFFETSVSRTVIDNQQRMLAKRDDVLPIVTHINVTLNNFLKFDFADFWELREQGFLLFLINFSSHLWNSKSRSRTYLKGN